MTLNFYPAADGTLIDRETVRKFLVSNPSITTVCGGYNNLEFTRADANKGVGLRKLAEILGVNPDATMAIGDTEMILPSLRLPVSVWQWEMPLMPSKPGRLRHHNEYQGRGGSGHRTFYPIISLTAQQPDIFL